MKDETVKNIIQEALTKHKKADTIEDEWEIVHQVNKEIIEQHLRTKRTKKEGMDARQNFSYDGRETQP